jgi:MurNAc alpha-1-phosphate uridylyltransferase
MVMAAGLGTRLRPFTEKTAKPLLPLMGVPMAQFAFDQLSRTSVEKIAANVHHLASASSQALRFLEHPGKIEISDESDILLGSAGGLAKAAPLFDGKPFFILNADTICNTHLRDLAKHHLLLRHQFGVRMTLLIFHRSPTAGLYREILVDERRSLIRGISDAKPHRMFYAGIAVIEPECLVDLPIDAPTDFVKNLLEPAIRLGRAGAFLFDNRLEDRNARWFDIGSPELWYQTHLDWMDLYENQELPAIWRDRIEKANIRLAPQIWISRRATARPDVAKWQAPCYWAPEAGESTPPARLSAGTVLYGKSPFPIDAPNPAGIGYRGLWKTMSGV